MWLDMNRISILETILYPSDFWIQYGVHQEESRGSQAIAGKTFYKLYVWLDVLLHEIFLEIAVL